MRSYSARIRSIEGAAADLGHLGGEIGMVAVHHTWGQNLQHHPSRRRLLLAAPTPLTPDPTADYRQRFRCLTGLERLSCQCR